MVVDLEKKVADLEKRVDEIKIISREWMRAGAVILALVLAWLGITNFVQIPTLVESTATGVVQQETEALRDRAMQDAEMIASFAEAVGGAVYACPYSTELNPKQDPKLSSGWSWLARGCLGQLSLVDSCRNIG